MRVHGLHALLPALPVLLPAQVVEPVVQVVPDEPWGRHDLPHDGAVRLRVVEPAQLLFPVVEELVRELVELVGGVHVAPTGSRGHLTGSDARVPDADTHEGQDLEDAVVLNVSDAVADLLVVPPTGLELVVVDLDLGPDFSHVHGVDELLQEVVIGQVVVLAVHVAQDLLKDKVIYSQL